jgi:hypothetical protein
MTTITDIRNDLVNVFNKLRDGTMEAKDAVEINNTAGKIIASAKVQLAYAALRGETPDIPFLQSPKVVEESTKLPNEDKDPNSLPPPSYNTRRIAGTRY